MSASPPWKKRTKNHSVKTGLKYKNDHKLMRSKSNITRGKIKKLASGKKILKR